MTVNRTIHTGVSNQSTVNHLQSPKKFSQKEVDLTQTPLFFPEGFEKIFLVLYFTTLPYIAGLLFLFFYIAEGKPGVFSSLYKNSSFILTWAIGYEIIAGLTLLWIVKMSLGFANESRKPGLKKQFRRP
ncbi:MAG: hypothetical protein KC427_08950 [Sulfurovum sp.]|uniref:hypothetical protein n=1 Tax=Sulfurovum sp. TaxID=1969726 RepID=UPI002868283C|nr:hypothetical protein [Sulfurovum sp.]MCO4846131.1 hypothetical protein [Sulfurovum sp.]